MFTKDEILTRLRNGTEATDIAQEMADNINAAIQEYEKEKAANNTRRRDARDLIDALADFFQKYFDEETLSESDREDATDELLKLVDNMKVLTNTINNAVSRSETARSKGTDDDLLSRWVKSL